MGTFNGVVRGEGGVLGIAGRRAFRTERTGRARQDRPGSPCFSSQVSWGEWEGTLERQGGPDKAGLPYGGLSRECNEDPRA